MKNLLKLRFIVLPIVFASLIPSLVQAQEVLRGLTVNPELIKFNQDKKKSKQLKAALVEPDSIEIPFVDDFSTTQVYPDPKLWLDKKVYINSTFPVNPVTIGVATFDALDENGYLYKNASLTPFGADTLTSRPFKFKGQQLDSMYFSFFYQPKGLGDMPDPTDSLILEFYRPDSAKWVHIWSTSGDSLRQFKQVLKQVTDVFKKDGFQFRFRNIASIDSSQSAGRHGNADQWHVDYVKLDKNRTFDDTILNDIAFVKPMTSLIKTFQSVPWKHYWTPNFPTRTKPTINITFRNNSHTPTFIRRSFKITEVLAPTNVIFSDNAGENTIPANTTQSLASDLRDVFVAEVTDTPVIKFDVMSYLSNTNDTRRENDTIHYTQVFDNYYAYDDGTSEAGYGIYGEGSQTAEVANQFTSYMQDKLTGIRFYFNATKNDTTTTVSFPFKLAVWKDYKGRPGDFLYKDNDSRTPKKLKLNQPYIFKLDSGIMISGTFYVGFIQESDNFLNIGFDLNNNNQNYLWINYNGTWSQSTIAGSLMMGPVFGNVQEGPVTGTKTIKGQTFSIYPNPADNVVYINTGNNGSSKPLIATIYDISGKAVLTSIVSDNSINVNGISSGFYFLKLSGDNTNYQPVKILIQH